MRLVDKLSFTIGVGAMMVTGTAIVRFFFFSFCHRRRRRRRRRCVLF